jgi:hypothetical protein
MKLRYFNVLFLVIVMLVSLSCSKKSDKKGIDLDVKILPETVTDCLYVKMNYQFKLDDKFNGMDNDYKIFVHFWREKTKEMMLQDDHSPEKPFSQWKGGDTVSYSRVIFIPQFIDEFDTDFVGNEDVRLTIGIHKPSDSKSVSTLFKKVINVRAASFNSPDQVYDEGWYQRETDLTIKDTNEQSWRWTAKRAVCIIENPKKESLLIIRGGVDKAIIPDQKVTIKLNNNVLEEFIPETAKFSKKFVVTPAMMGNEDDFKLTIETDKTFIPSKLDKVVKDSKDNRELGVQIFFLYFRENIK